MIDSVHCPICSAIQYRREVSLEHAQTVVCCLSCGAGYLVPRPDGSDLAALHSSDDYFDHPYFESRRELSPAMKAIYGRRLRLLEAGLGGSLSERRVLDVGCDTGAFMQYLSEAGRASCVGIDVFPRVVEVARSSGLEAHCGTLESCTLPGNSIDAVCAFDLIEHVDDPARFLSEAHRVMKPGGLIVLETPNFDGLVYRLGRVLGRTGLLRGLLAPLQARLWPQFHVQYFTQHSMQTALQSAGFGAVTVRQRELEARELAVGHPVLRAAVLLVFTFARIIGSGSLLVATARKSAGALPKIP